MSDVAVRVQGLSKRYRIGAVRHDNIREAITHALKAPLRGLRRFAGDDEPQGARAFWALQDVSFDVARGTVLGITGGNGAGKSTLLKILSRIVEPTSGRAEVWGRVGSLLEVGTGFHPELTGRDNIYLNGAILGMSRAHMDRVFDAIVEFSGVEAFLDTPVKRYSSGMHMRLAFAVAAHLEPDVLIVDEALSVGDAEFQARCMDKMRAACLDGRTVIFVSHDESTLTELAHRIIHMSAGRIVGDEVVDTILTAAHATTRPHFTVA